MQQPRSGIEAPEPASRGHRRCGRVGGPARTARRRRSADGQLGPDGRLPPAWARRRTTRSRGTIGSGDDSSTPPAAGAGSAGTGHPAQAVPRRSASRRAGSRPPSRWPGRDRCRRPYAPAPGRPARTGGTPAWPGSPRTRCRGRGPPRPPPTSSPSIRIVDRLALRCARSRSPAGCAGSARSGARRPRPGLAFADSTLISTRTAPASRPCASTTRAHDVTAGRPRRCSAPRPRRRSGRSPAGR